MCRPCSGTHIPQAPPSRVCLARRSRARSSESAVRSRGHNSRQLHRPLRWSLPASSVARGPGGEVCWFSIATHCNNAAGQLLTQSVVQFRAKPPSLLLTGSGNLFFESVLLLSCLFPKPRKRYFASQFRRVPVSKLDTLPRRLENVEP